MKQIIYNLINLPFVEDMITNMGRKCDVCNCSLPTHIRGERLPCVTFSLPSVSGNHSYPISFVPQTFLNFLWNEM